MKTLLYIASIFSIAAALVSCEKNNLNVRKITPAENAAQAKINFFSSYRANPPYQIKINDVRVSNNLTYATPFPGGGLNTGGGSTADYLFLTPGTNKISVSLPKAGSDVDSIVLKDTTVTLTANVKHSLYFSDTGSKTNVLVVLDTLSKPDSGFAKYKFINLIPDLAAADLYVGTTKVASSIPYRGISASFTVPTNSSSASWSIREAGGTTALVSYAGTVANTIGNQRVYTVVARGYKSLSTTSTAEPRRRTVSLIYNE